MQKRLFVISVDAMVTEDIDAMRALPNFRKLFVGGCEVAGGMTSIYPTVTYPIHVAMTTGCYAGKNGVVSNYGFTTGSTEKTWNFDSSVIKTETIFEAAKKAGYTTASVGWPVTGNNPYIDYLANEYWMPNEGDTLLSSFRDAGSSPEVLELIEKNKGLLPEGYEKGGRMNVMKWPEIDDFWVGLTCDLIEKYRPEVFFLHTGAFDHYRHTNGQFSSALIKAREDLEKYLGQIAASMEKAGVLKDTNFVMVSDHGQRNILRSVNLNVLLAREGFITPDEDGKVKSWEAYCFSNAMSSLVYLRDPKDKDLKDNVYAVLNELLKADPGSGIGRVFTAEEAAREYALSGDFSFVLESDGLTSFGNKCAGPLMQTYDPSDFRFGKATHGYRPEYGPQPVFIAKGPDFKENVLLEHSLIINEAPTYAALLGTSLKDADGSALTMFLR